MAQESASILCLHPPNARGLLLITLHNVFLCFQHKISRPLLATETVAVQIAASELCSRIEEPFEDEASRGRAFDECVSGILKKGEVDCKLKPYPSSHYDKIDQCIQEANIPIASIYHNILTRLEPYESTDVCMLIVWFLSPDKKSIGMSISTESYCFCHKLHSIISPPILQRFPRSQSQIKSLKKTFRSMPVMSQGNQ